MLLRGEGVSFQRLKAWKTSRDPDYQVKKARIEHLYAVADGEVVAEASEPTVVFCLDEFGPLNLMPARVGQWAPISGKGREPGRDPPPRMRATYTRTHGVPPVRRLRPVPRQARLEPATTRECRAVPRARNGIYRPYSTADVSAALLRSKRYPHRDTRRLVSRRPDRTPVYDTAQAVGCPTQEEGEALMTTLTTTDAEYLRMSIDLSRHALDDQGKTPFGAILVLDDEVVSEGTSSVIELFDPSAHAEVMALRNAARKLQRHLLPGVGGRRGETWPQMCCAVRPRTSPSQSRRSISTGEPA